MEPVAALDEVVVKTVLKPTIQNKTQMSSIDLPMETIKSFRNF
jgi:hypothetical protein